LEALRDELAQADGVASVRGIGLLLGIELGRGGSRLAGAGAAIAREALGRGLIALPAGDDGHVLELTPPLGLTEEQTAFVARELSAAIRGALEPAGHGA
jgi:4-aminobutyrate aminotransferase-like enzyme